MADPFIGEIRIFAGNFAPRDWAFCNGQTLLINQNTALFSILGTTYGGDGRTTVRLPDLQARVPVHEGRGPGLTNRRLGEKGGADEVTLNTSQVPSHSHSLGGLGPTLSRDDDGSPADNTVGGLSLYADANNSVAAMASTALTEVGANGSHENRHPVLGLNFIIALNGTYPQRG